jgi:hypothetical protein
MQVQRTGYEPSQLLRLQSRYVCMQCEYDDPGAPDGHYLVSVVEAVRR